MPAFANIVINDGATTPVAHTFAPASETPDNVFNHVDSSPGVGIGFNWLKLSLAAPNGNVTAGQASGSDRVYRAKLSLVLPTLEVTSPNTGTGIQPAPTVAYSLRANVECIIPERSALQDRKNLNALLKNALANAQWTAQVESLQSIY